MHYNPQTKSLHSSDGTELKKSNCPITIQPEHLERIEDSRDRICITCKRNIISLDGIPESQAIKLIRSTSDSCHFHSNVQILRKAPSETAQRPIGALNGPPPMSPTKTVNMDKDRTTSEIEDEPDFDPGCPRIRTIRDFARIQELSEAGARILIKPVTVSPLIKLKAQVWKNKRTGSLQINDDYRWKPNQADCDWELIVPWFTYRPNPPTGIIAAYIIPLKLQPSDRVYIDDIIEDIPQSINDAQGEVGRLDSAFAIWSGQDLIIEVPETRGFVG